MLYGLVCQFIFIIFIFRGQSLLISVESEGGERRVQHNCHEPNTLGISYHAN